ncbi:cytochrome P450 [Phaeobacter sp. HF9A]|uniref:cytochrome P450 n=1 Tax=Phaeobacter sp. HF9A TaxID=2721561 RepID=UPI001430D1C6|nr:cytochrome P450 [Phaeobacter sp. HF9A]NIZ13555.1 cytochrome P450 [Phaeobacter sp. HF9A]
MRDIVTELQPPVFDAASSIYDDMGILKVVEDARRRVGDLVSIRTTHGYDALLLADLRHIRQWKNNQGHFALETPTEGIESQSDITRVLNGDALERPENAAVWDATRQALSRINRAWPDLSQEAARTANQNLCAAMTDAVEGSDLRLLCARWSVVSVLPAIFGPVASDDEMVETINLVERFYYVVSRANGREAIQPEAHPEFRAARAALDGMLSRALDQMQPDDRSVVAELARSLPTAQNRAELIDWMRPAVSMLLLDKVIAEGAGLLWALVSLAQHPDLATEMAREMVGRDPQTADFDETPLCRAFVMETQRLYPEQAVIHRFANQDLEIDGYQVPKGQVILFAPWLLHRDPRYWAEPKRFDPTRFMAPLEDKTRFIPFGVGAATLKRSKAMMEALLPAVRTVCAARELRLHDSCAKGSLRPFLRNTISPRGPVPACFVPRAPLASK